MIDFNLKFLNNIHYIRNFDHSIFNKLNLIINRISVCDLLLK